MGKQTRLLAATLIASAGLQACVSSLHSIGLDDMEERPALLGDGWPVAVPRREIDRYRCASGAILQCSGSSDAVATCICASGLTLPWVPD